MYKSLFDQADRSARPAESLAQQALRELMAVQCACGARKVSNESFCRSCYFELPRNMRTSLYKMMSDGYATAYDAAKDWLRSNTERLKGRKK